MSAGGEDEFCETGLARRGTTGAMEGYILKKGKGKMDRWKKRYCVIDDGGVFTYYEKEGGKSKGSFVLRDCAVSLGTAKPPKTYEFSVDVPGNRLVKFKATSEADRQAWVVALMSYGAAAQAVAAINAQEADAAVAAQQAVVGDREPIAKKLLEVKVKPPSSVIDAAPFFRRNRGAAVILTPFFVHYIETEHRTIQSSYPIDAFKCQSNGPTIQTQSLQGSMSFDVIDCDAVDVETKVLTAGNNWRQLSSKFWGAESLQWRVDRAFSLPTGILFSIQLIVDGVECAVQRNFEDFRKLIMALSRQFPKYMLPALPRIGREHSNLIDTKDSPLDPSDTGLRRENEFLLQFMQSCAAEINGCDEVMASEAVAEFLTGSDLLVAVAKVAESVETAMAFVGTDGVNVSRFDGATALHMAAVNQSEAATELVVALIEAGADENAVDENGGSVLHYAAKAGSIATLTMLCDSFPGLTHARDKRGDFPIHWAARRGQADAVTFFLHRNASQVNVSNRKGEKPLFLAACAKSIETALTLLSFDAAIDDGQSNGVAAIHAAAQYDSTELVVLLIKSGANANLLDGRSRSPLNYAARYNAARAATALLKAGAEPDLVNLEHRSPIHVAAMAHNLDVLAAFLHFNKKLADLPDSSVDKFTPLHAAAGCGHRAVAELLLAFGAAIEARSGAGDTPLILAASLKQADMVRLLVGYGAQLDAVGGHGFTATMHALNEGVDDLAVFLAGAGASLTLVTHDGKTANSYASPEVRRDLLNAARNAQSVPVPVRTAAVDRLRDATFYPTLKADVDAAEATVAELLGVSSSAVDVAANAAIVKEERDRRQAELVVDAFRDGIQPTSNSASSSPATSRTSTPAVDVMSAVQKWKTKAGSPSGGGGSGPGDRSSSPLTSPLASPLSTGCRPGSTQPQQQLPLQHPSRLQTPDKRATGGSARSSGASSASNRDDREQEVEEFAAVTESKGESSGRKPAATPPPPTGLAGGGRGSGGDGGGGGGGSTGGPAAPAASSPAKDNKKSSGGGFFSRRGGNSGKTVSGSSESSTTGTSGGAGGQGTGNKDKGASGTAGTTTVPPATGGTGAAAADGDTLPDTPLSGLVKSSVGITPAGRRLGKASTRISSRVVGGTRRNGRMTSLISVRPSSTSSVASSGSGGPAAPAAGTGGSDEVAVGSSLGDVLGDINPDISSDFDAVRRLVDVDGELGSQGFQLSSTASEISRIGILAKQESQLRKKTWKQFLFVLRGDFLRYYNLKSPIKPSQGVRLVDSTVSAVDSKPTDFVLRERRVALTLRCPTVAAASEWLDAINAERTIENASQESDVYLAALAPDHCGAMAMQGGVLKSWQNVWVSLSRGMFYVFDSDPNDLLREKGSLPVRNATAESMSIKGRRYTFKVRSAQNTHFLAAESAASAAAWIEAVRAARAVHVDEVDDVDGDGTADLGSGAGSSSSAAAAAGSGSRGVAKRLPLDKKQAIQVRVHIHEVRDLKARSRNNLSDPITTVELFGKKQRTAVAKATLSAVYDTTFFFEDSLTGREVDECEIDVRVSDANTVMRNQLIGSCAIGLGDVFRRPGQELFKQWIGLVDTAGEHDGVQGFLRLSVAAMGPGDTAPIHHPDEGEEVVEGSTLQDLVLLPPDVESNVVLLKVNIYRAEDLPRMDKVGWIDAFVSIKFGGNPAIKTRYIKRKKDPDWNETLHIPVSTPTLSDTVVVRVYDWDAGQSNELVGVTHFSFAAAAGTATGIPPTWCCLYGPASGAAYDGSETAYRGRVLLSASVQDAVNPTLTVHDITSCPEPPARDHTLWFDLYSLSELPVSRDRKVVVEVALGPETVTVDVPVKGRFAMPYVQLDPISLSLPADDPAQLPDVFVNIYTKNAVGGKTRLAYIRYHAAGVVESTGEPFWDLMHFAPESSADSTFQVAGYILLSLRLGPTRAMPVRRPLSQPVLKPYVLRAYIYQARNLLAADQNGLSDPYARVVCGAASKVTTTKRHTLNPTWYETIELEVELPTDLRLAPDVHVMLYDWDRVEHDDFLGRFSFSPAAASERFPEVPTWHDIYLESPDASIGQVLAAFQLLPADVAARSGGARDITPEFRDTVVEVRVLGTRSLKAPSFLRLSAPLVEFGTGDRDDASLWGETGKSSNPSARNANFFAVKRLNLHLPVDPLFAPALSFTVFDVGVVRRTRVGVASVPLGDLLPWVNHDRTDPLAATIRTGGALQPNAASPASLGASGGGGGGGRRDKGKAPADEGYGGGGYGACGAGVGSGDVAVYLSSESSEDSFLDTESEDMSISSDSANESTWLFTPRKGKGESTRVQRSKTVGGHESGRPTIHAELESMLTESPPFMSIPISLGADTTSGTFVKQKSEAADDSSKVSPLGPADSMGVIKANVVVYDADRPVPALADIASKYETELYIVRVYVLRGHALTPHDANNSSDPFIKMKLCGKTVVNDSSNVHKETLNPQFYKCYQFEANLPGESSLAIEVWDWDLVGSNDLIGETLIDLEQRALDDQWQEMRATGLPIEYRTLWNKESVNPQGQLEMYVDILSLDEAAAVEPDPCAPPPPQHYEMRVVVWKTRDVVPKDKVNKSGASSDVFVSAEFGGDASTRQQTDTQWNSDNGSGAFNWRFKFDINIPTPNPRLKIQLWDAELVGRNEFIGEATLDLDRPCADAAAKGKKKKLKKQWVALSHPSHEGLQGSVQIQVDLVPWDAAVAKPVGKGRDEPNREPFLEVPDRPDSSFHPWRLDKQITVRGIPWMRGMIWKHKQAVALATAIPILLLFLKFLFSSGYLDSKKKGG